MTRPEPGLEFLPRLVLLRPLGRGGMGEAWVARDERRGEQVVAKLLPVGAPEERVALLRREARLVRKLAHPGIVPVYGFESGPHGSCVLLRYMRGGDAGRLRGAPVLEVVRRGREVAEALAYLHGLGVVHRDVKPSNVLLDEEGRAHLADFGIAAVATPEDDEGLVLRGGGSRASMSPQQRAGEPAQPADDVYALGALLYELLSGRPPFAAEADDETIAKAPPPLAPAHPVPEGLRTLVLSMLAKAPRDRPRDMKAVVAALQEIETDLAGASPAPQRRPAVRLQPPPRVPDVGILVPSARPASATADRARRRSGTLSWVHVALLGSLALAAVFVVVVLPRWGSAPSPSPSAGASPPDAVGNHPDATAARDGSARPPAEATPSPPEATPTPSRPAASPRGGAVAEPAGRDRAAFEAAMSEAHTSLERADWAAARRSFERAGALRPGSTAVADGLRRVEEQERAAALARHREAARGLESKEDWKGAIAEYDAALKLDPTVAFAQEGRARASRRALLAERLDFHAGNPHRLSTDAVAREAEAVLQEAREIDPPGPRHRKQTADLERALARALTPVAVVLQSDGVTEVAVHKVGRLGAFRQKSLELRPGTYTVVGTRRGYRDVRRTLVVTPDAPPDPLVVRCEEAI